MGRKEYLLKIDKNVVSDKKEFLPADEFRPWQMLACRDAQALDLLYDGPEVKITKTIPSPFFSISEKFYGLYIDVKTECDRGLNLNIKTHASYYETLESPLAVPLSYDVELTDKLLLIFRYTGEINIKTNQPLAEIGLSPKEKTNYKICQIDKIKFDCSPTRNINGINNVYEILSYLKKQGRLSLPARVNFRPLIFNRDY